MKAIFIAILNALAGALVEWLLLRLKKEVHPVQDTVPGKVRDLHKDND